jgi:hypothetical protein
MKSIERRARENEEDYNRRNRSYDEYTDASSILRAVNKNEEDPEIYEKEAEELKRLENIYDIERSKNDKKELDAKRDIVRKKNILDLSYKSIGGKDIKKEQFEIMKNLRESKRFLKEKQTGKEKQYERINKLVEKDTQNIGGTRATRRGNMMEDEVFNNDKLIEYVSKGKGNFYNSKEIQDPYYSEEYMDFLKDKYKTTDIIKSKALDYFPMDGLGKNMFMDVKSLDGDIEKFKKEGGIHIGGVKFGRTNAYGDAMNYEPVFLKDPKTGFIKEKIYYKTDTDDIRNIKPLSGDTTKGPPKEMSFVVSLEDGKYYCNLSRHPELWKEYTEEYYDDGLDEYIEIKSYGLNWFDTRSNPEGIVKRANNEKGNPIIPIKFWKKIPIPIAE